MSDDLDFDMEVVGDDELNEMGADGASSSEERSRVKSDGLRNETGGGSDFDTKSGSFDEPNSKALDSRPEDSDRRETNPSIKDIDVEDWKAVRAEELMHITRGASPRPKGDPELFGGDIPWVKISDVDVKSERYATKTSDTVTEKGAKKSKHIAEDTLIVSNSGTCGYPVFLGMDACVHDGWLILKEYEEELNADYLYEYITWKQNYLKSLAPGSTQINLNTSRFGSLDIQVPPLPEQRKIASILYAVDQAIQKTEEIIEQAKRVKRGLMQKLFREGLHGGTQKEVRRIGQIPSEWEVVRLGDVCDQITDGTHQSPETKEEGFPYITSQNIRDWGFDLSDMKYISKEAHEKITSRCSPQKGDVLYVKDGANTGTVQVNTLGFEFSLLSSVALIRTTTDILDPLYLKHLLSWPKFRQLMMSRMSGTGISRLTISKIEKSEIILPPTEEQQRISDILNTFDDTVTKEDKRLKTLKGLKRGLMQDLLTGEVRTADTTFDVLNEVVEHG